MKPIKPNSQGKGIWQDEGMVRDRWLHLTIRSMVDVIIVMGNEARVEIKCFEHQGSMAMVVIDW